MINNSKSNIEYWLALKLVPRLAIHKKVALVEAYDLAALFSLNNKPSVLSSANGLSVKAASSFSSTRLAKNHSNNPS